MPQQWSEAFGLPVPDAEAVAISEQLIERIIDRINQSDGVIGFDEYMHMALYQPGLGYYVAGSAKFGPSGDFVTAPEISSLFGGCLANQLHQLIKQGCAAQVLEFGAGSGALCAQIMQALPSLGCYQILEPSPDLRQRQQAYLRQRLEDDLFVKVEWLSGLPENFTGVVLANEVIDAMPVHRVERRLDWVEMGVGFDGDRFEWRRMNPQAELREFLISLESRLGEFSAGYCTEVNLNHTPWMQALADLGDELVILIIDYGYEQPDYYRPQRASGTLICHYRHRVHDDPLIYPGLQDITAFVDFDALADAGEAAGFATIGLVSQAEFLIANGLSEAAQQRATEADERTLIHLTQEIKTLTLPQEMGEKFKVLAMQKGLTLDVPAMRRGVDYG